MLRQVAKGKDRPNVGRPDPTEIVGPTKWVGHVSVQFWSGPYECFALEPNQSLLSPQFSFPHLTSHSGLSSILIPAPILYPSGLLCVPARQEEGKIPPHLGLSSELFFHSASRLIFWYVFQFKIFFVSV